MPPPAAMQELAARAKIAVHTYGYTLRYVNMLSITQDVLDQITFFYTGINPPGFRDTALELMAMNAKHRER